MSKLIQKLFKDGFLQVGEIEGNSFFHLTTPCRFNIKQNVVKSLKDKYISDEEIGGILWAKPTSINGEKIYVIEEISFVSNVIEDTKPRYRDKEGRVRTRKDAYLPDKKEQSEAIEKIILADSLPIKFHTHPTKGRNTIEHITLQQLTSETSEQDRFESTQTQKFGNDNLLLPRGLIVGNGDIGNNIFIGLYNGFIAPVDFEESKKSIQEENIQRISNAISSAELNDKQKVLLGVGALLLLIAVLKYPKYSLPVILALATSVPTLLSDTGLTEKPAYFNKLSNGDANIYIP